MSESPRTFAAQIFERFLDVDAVFLRAMLGQIGFDEGQPAMAADHLRHVGEKLADGNRSLVFGNF